MSGFLRRIKRSRAADTGETSAEGLGAGPEGAPTAETSAAASSAKTSDTSAAANSAKTTELPAGAVAADATGPVLQTSPGAGAGTGALATETGPGAVAGPDVAAGPVGRADADTPAGLDPAEAGAKVATGRRGRLRRRLRYLRRARELMLRDLGGLIYEVHRTGGGEVAAHTGTIGAKVERLSALDAETATIETALGATRGQTVVFEPGIGGTCEICGELYGSAARFCSSCGAPAGATARSPAPPAEQRPVPAMPKPPAPATSQATADQARRAKGSAPAAPADDNRPQEGASAPAPADAPAAADDNRPQEGASAPAPTDAPAAVDENRPHDAPGADGAPRADGEPPNGRAEPGLSSDDPLAAKRSSS